MRGITNVHFVFPNASGMRAEPLMALSDADSELLRSAVDAGVESPKVQARLSEICRARLWIACACREDRGVPLIAVARGHDGHYRLVHLVDRPTHHQRCRFAALPSPAAIVGQTPSLVAVMRNLISAAKINQIVMIQHPSAVIGDQAAAIANASRELFIERRVKLGKFLSVDTTAIEGLARKIHNSTDRFADAPWGIVLTLAERVADGTVHCVGRDLEVGDAAIHTLGDPNSEGPILAALRVEADQQGAPVVTEVAVQPILSHTNLFPVSGAMERVTVRRMLEVQDDLRRSGTVFRFIKPMQPEVAGRGTAFCVSRMGITGRFGRSFDVFAVDTRALSLPWRMPESESSALAHDVYGAYEFAFADALEARLGPGQAPVSASTKAAQLATQAA